MARVRADGRQVDSAAAAMPPILDADHLNSITFGDRQLEREVLQLFERQSAMLLERMRAASPTEIASCAHTLKGSARGIGAWRVAGAAERIEHSAGRDAAGQDAVLARLVEAVDEVRRAIAQRVA